MGMLKVVLTADQTVVKSEHVKADRMVAQTGGNWADQTVEMMAELSESKLVVWKAGL